MQRSGHSVRRILLVDADAFFVAVARQVDPKGAGRAPLLIVGGNPGSRGVVCSASYECRAYGVRSAMPISQALRLCPDAMCVPVPRSACLRMSREIRSLLTRFAPLVQASSIDEWYCDLSGTEVLYGGESLSETAQRIRQAVLKETGITVSVGCGTSKYVAKIAAGSAKPGKGTSHHGVHCVEPGTEARFLSTFRLSDLPMVGPRLASRLSRHGLVMVSDAQRWSERLLRARFGERTGSWLYARIRGYDDSEVLANEQQKQLSRETTFARDITDSEIIARELQRQTLRVSIDLRKQQLRARTVTVKLRDSEFRTRTAQRTFRSPIEAERPIVSAAHTLLAKLRTAQNSPVRLLGVSLSHFDTDVGPMDAAPDGYSQLALFPGFDEVDDDPREDERDRALSRALDDIRGRYGATAILPARLLADPSSEIGPGVEE